MRTLIVALVATVACGSPSRPTASTPAPGATRTYTNPIIDDDFADPAVLRANDGWIYAYATQVTSGARRINIQVACSHDLVTWDRLPYALPTKPTNGNGDLPSRRPLLLDRIVYKDGWPTIATGTPSFTPQPAPAITR